MTSEFTFTNDADFTICVGCMSYVSDYDYANHEDDIFYVQTHGKDDDQNVVYIDTNTAKRVAEALLYLIDKKKGVTDDKGTIHY